MPATAPDRSDPPAKPHSRASLGWSLGMVLRSWQEHVEDAVRDIPQGSRGYLVLLTVTQDVPPTQGALASRLAIDRTVLTYLIDDLEAAGLVERQLDPRDRRARRIVATEKGQRVLAEAERRVAATEERILGGLAEPERSAFYAAAERAAEAIQAADPDTNPCQAVQEIMDYAGDERPSGRRPTRTRAGSR